MASDEAETLRVLQRHRHELLDPLVQEHNGRTVKLVGDGALLEFSSVVDAVQFAETLQLGMRERNGSGDYDVEINFRVGINIGDVIIDGDDIYGDGVNVAARIEALAEPGGIAISADVFNQIRRKVELDFDDLGEQQVKNIPEPVRVYHAVPGAGPGLQGGRSSGRATANPGVRQAGPLLAAALLILIASGSAVWFWTHEESKKTQTVLHEPPGLEAGRPSIAVMPFVNMSNDPEQEYFVDGIAEDLITDLAKISGLMVIARNSTFVYKDTSVDLRQVSRELGARYVLEGSVRRSGDAVRINAQLIDGSDGSHVWADRYDRKLIDVFALQDEVTQSIVTALSVNLTDIERDRFGALETSNIDAYDLRLRALEVQSRFTPEDNRAGRELYREATRLDPLYARAWAAIGLTHAIDINMNWSDNRERSIELGMSAINRALELDDAQVRAYFAMAAMLQAQRRFEEAIERGRQVVKLEPNYADGWAQLAFVLVNTGHHEEGLQAIENAKRLNPRSSQLYMYVEAIGLFMAGEYGQMIELLERAIERNPAFDRIHLLLASGYGHVGRLDDAGWNIEEVLVHRPDLTLATERRNSAFKNTEDIDRYIEGLRRSGFPE